MGFLKAIGKGFLTTIGVLVALILFVGVACDSDTTTQEVGSSVENQTVEGQNEEQSKKEEVVVVDNEYCLIALEEEFSEYNEVGFKVRIENKCDQPLLIGFNDVSVNGVMNDPFWADSVDSGMTSYGTIGWYTTSESNPNVKSMEDLINIKGRFSISNNDTWSSLAEETVIINATE